MNIRVTLIVMAACAAAAAAQPEVPPGFSASRLAPLLDGQVPQLSAIDDPDFGTGVLTATAANGIVTIRLVEATGRLRVIAVWNQAPPSARVLRVRLDRDNIIDGGLHVTVADVPGLDTHYLTVSSSGVVTRRWGRTDEEWYDFDFTAGGNGNPSGVVILDQHGGGEGTSLGWMDSSYRVTITNPDSKPSDRIDTDVQGFQRDVTGLYGGGILLADWDGNDDEVAVLYELRDVLSGGTYREISNVGHLVRRYGDLAIAASGDFGGVVYITDVISGEIQQVTPDGAHTTWATGFSGIDSLSISPDGNSMYVGDGDGVWLIRAAGNDPGPVVLTTDPSVPTTSQLTGNPVASFRVIFNEPVGFADADITITNAGGDPVGFDASGSASQFMLIGLAEALFGDTYTVTIADTVTSVATGEPLDGDNDGFSGGDAVLTFTHRCPGDFNADGIINTIDVLQFLNAWTAGCP